MNKNTRIITLIIATIATLTLSAQSLTVAPKGKRISPTDTNINYVGRINFNNPESPQFTFPGIQIMSGFTGTSLRMIAKPMSGYFMAQIDDCEAFKVSFNSERDSIVNLATALPYGEHQVRLMYVTEGYNRKGEFRGFLLDDDCRLIPSSVSTERRLEFIGNSITCGYGVEATDKNEHFLDETCNHYYTYAAITARSLNAIHQVVARSGIGVYRNYNGPITGDKINMNTEYQHTLLYDSLQWDFSKFKPQLICINLGTNDTSTTGADPALLKQGYRNLFNQVRKAYPDAKVLFLSGSMMSGKDLEVAQTAMNTVVEELHAEGEQEVYRFDFTPQDGSLGYGADWHPSMEQQQKMADELIPYVSKLMGWK